MNTKDKNDVELLDRIKAEEDLFPKIFSNFVEREYGILFFNSATKDSNDSNHGLIYKNNVTNLDIVLKDITGFYKGKGLTPLIYQATNDEGYFSENSATFSANGYDVQIYGPNHFMLLTADNIITSSNRLDIRLLSKWDERIATDLCNLSGEGREIEVIKNSINNDLCRVFVGYINEIAIAITYFHLSEHDCCRFDYMIVATDFRKKGFSRAMLSYVTDYCRQHHIHNCFQWPAHETSERICYEAGFRTLFTAEAARASF